MTCIFGASSLGGIFADTLNPTTASLVFFTPTREQNDFGEVIVSYASHITLVGDLQPRTGKFPRYVHGDVEQTNAVLVVLGNPDVSIGDRTLVSAQFMEIMDVDRYGTTQAEISLKWVR